MRMILSAVVLSLVFPAAPESQEAPRSDFIERAFVSNGRVRMDLAAGEYRIEGSPDTRIRLDWRVNDGGRLADVRARADVRGTEATITTDAPDKASLRGTIRVPMHADLDVYLTAGDLRIDNVEGNKDVRLQAGQIRINMGRPEEYQRVRASVWVGDLQAEPFYVRKGGFFRSFTWTGQGRYQLRARLKAGEIRLY